MNTCNDNPRPYLSTKTADQTRDGAFADYGVRFAV
jgi:hypothetical protein